LEAAVVFPRDTSQDRRIFHFSYGEIDPLEGKRFRVRRAEAQDLKFIKCRTSLFIESLLGLGGFLDRDRLEKSICSRKAKELWIQVE
jgi:hypothetical protein